MGATPPNPQASLRYAPVEAVFFLLRLASEARPGGLGAEPPWVEGKTVLTAQEPNAMVVGRFIELCCYDVAAI